MKHFYTNITKSILTLAILMVTSAVSFANTIVIASGTTSTYSTFMDGTQIEVYGTLTFNPSYNNGTTNKVTVYSGGTLTVTSSALYSVILDVKSGGVLNFTASNFSMANTNTGIINAGTLNAPNTNLTLNTDAGFENSGSATIKGFTVNSTQTSGVLNKNTGSLTINGSFTNNGSYENASSGTMQVAGSFTNNSGFTTSGTMTVGGTATINGAVTLNGALTVAGNVTINSPVTGTNGSLTVTNGKSVMNASGKFTGTGMWFDDLNTTNHNFDVNTSTTTNIYSVGAAPQSAPVAILPLRFVSFSAVEYNQTMVYFKFSTTVETSLENIQLQGSTDGKNYYAIENFTPHNTNGLFNYTSAKIESSKYTSYRIAVINLDGGRDYSTTIFYKSSASSATEASIFPNPVVNETFNVKVPSSDPAIVRIFTNDGRMLFNTVLKGQQQYQVTMPSSAPRNNLVTIQIIHNGNIKAFTVLNK